MSWTVNNVPVVAGSLQHPDTTTWSARVQLESDAAPAGSVQLELPGLSLRGAVVDAGTFSGRTTAWLVGGSGKLGVQIPGQHFRAATGLLVAQSIVGAAGEALDPQSTGLDGALQAYCYHAGLAGSALTRLAQALGLSWWITPEGLVHFGVRDYPAATPDVLVLDRSLHSRQLLVAPQAAPVPGTTFDGLRILAVDHTLAKSRWRAELRY